VKGGYRSWGVTLAGDPVDVTAAVLAPPITTPSAFNLMELSHDPEDYVFAALRMTRRWRLDGARTDWLKGKKTKGGTPRKTLPAADRTTLISALRPTTVLDFMYELRVRTNHEGVEEYGSDADDSTVEQLHRGLLHLTDMGLLHYECDLAQAIGLSRYEDAVNEWGHSVAKVGGWAADRVLRRLGHIRTALKP
jgi:hypothetical protein